jgi:capsular polysaccharide biosynthesis protein
VESPLSTQTANKIFISRKVSQNRSYNEEELIKIACQHGYTVVYPEQFSVREQFALFSQVDSIIAASGAALSNIVCCKPGCKILVLTSSHWNLTVFSNIAGHLNLDMEYMCGKTDNPNDVQSGFVIDAGIFRKVLNK